MSSSNQGWSIPEKITFQKILVVEGQDEANFCDALLKNLKCTEQVHIINIHGKEIKDKKKGFPLLLKVSNFQEIVRTIGFIFDAEENPAKSTFDSIKSLLKNEGLPQPSNLIEFTTSEVGKLSTGIFICPDCLNPGMLEDLCIKSIPENFQSCYDNFIKCIDTPPSKRPSKAKIQTYLAINNPLRSSLGVAAQANIWDFNHTCFDDIKKFLLNFTQQPF